MREIYSGEKSTFRSEYIHFRIEIAWPALRNVLYNSQLQKSGFTLSRKIRGESAGGVGRRVDNAQARDSKFYKIIPSSMRAAYSFFRRDLPLGASHGEGEGRGGLLATARFEPRTYV